MSKIKTVILLPLSICVVILGMILNLDEFIFGHARTFNLLVTLCVLIFWISYFFIARNNRILMVYATMYWIIAFLGSILIWFILYTKAQMILGLLLFVPFCGSLFGITIISRNNMVSIWGIIMVTFIFAYCGLLLSVRKKK